MIIGDNMGNKDGVGMMFFHILLKLKIKKEVKMNFMV
jgi:hypothetical protein